MQRVVALLLRWELTPAFILQTAAFVTISLGDELDDWLSVHVPGADIKPRCPTLNRRPVVLSQQTGDIGAARYAMRDCPWYALGRSWAQAVLLGMLPPCIAAVDEAC